MRDFFGWFFMLMFIGGLILAVHAAVVGKLLLKFGAKDSTNLKCLLIVLIGVAMVACGWIWLEVIGSNPPPPQGYESQEQ